MRARFAFAFVLSCSLASCSGVATNPGSDAATTDSGLVDVAAEASVDTSACVGFSTDAGMPADPNALMRAGRTAAEACAFCHRQNFVFAGQDFPRPGSTQYGNNITPDPDTGIGRHTDEEFCRVVRFGLARDGRALCPLMTRYTAAQLSDENLRALLFFLRAQPPVRRMVPRSTCP